MVKEAVAGALREAWGDGSAGSRGTRNSSAQDEFRRCQLPLWKNKCAFTNLSTDQGSLQACRIIPLRAKFHSLDLGWEVRLRGLCECSYSHVGPARGTQSGKEMLGHLSTDQGKMWVLHHLGRKHRINIHTLNHPSNGFLAVQVCLLYAAACVHSPADRCQRCQHVDAFPSMSTRGLTPSDCLLTCSATHLSWWCGTRDTLARQHVGPHARPTAASGWRCHPHGKGAGRSCHPRPVRIPVRALRSFV